MRRGLKVLLVALIGLALLLAIAAGQHYKLFERTWFNLTQWYHGDTRRAASLWLPDYRALVQARQVEGIDDDLSALTFDPDAVA